jgi:hypothetical protein
MRESTTTTSPIIALEKVVDSGWSKKVSMLQYCVHFETCGGGLKRKPKIRKGTF